MKRVLQAYMTEDSAVTPEEVRMLTHINIAFGHLFRDGHVECAGHSKIAMVKSFREWNPDIKVCLSMVDGDGVAFTTVAGSDRLRAVLADEFVRVLREYDLDGIDLDWEYPCVPSNFSLSSYDDRENFTLLLRDIRRAFDREFKEHKLLTIAAGADIYYTNIVDLPEISGILDYIYLMTYDLKCGFHALTGHHTALYSNRGDYFENSCDRAMRLFEAKGVPARKLVMGAAFYSRKWENVPDRNKGFLQLTPAGAGYGPGFDELDESYIDKNGYKKYWDDEAKAPYLFNGSTFISYDDEESVRLKAEYVLEHAYGGIFYWVHGRDKKDKLLTAIYNTLNV